MANKRTRERHLAKLAARRQADRMAGLRRRNRIVAASAGLITAIVVFVVGINLFADNGPPKASPRPSTSSPVPKPGTKTGTVTLVAHPPAKVACGGTAPKSARKPKPQFTEPKITVDKKVTYIARIVTSCGTIEVQLLPKVAPEGVNSFVFLAKKGFYDGLTFHRIVKGFVAQGGDPKGDGTGTPGYAFKIETSKRVTFDRPGLLAYANGGPGTNGSQFFITLAKLPQLNPTPQASYTIFGKVIAGMGVVHRIARVHTATGTGCASATEKCVPSLAVYIDGVTIHVQKPSSSLRSSPSP